MEQPKLDPVDELRQEMAQKAAELSEVHKTKVHPILFFADEEMKDPVKGYLKEPARLAKTRILDKSTQLGDWSAAAEMMELCLIKEESDSRMWSEAQECDQIYFGACNECQKLIRISLNQFKKK